MGNILKTNMSFFSLFRYSVSDFPQPEIADSSLDLEDNFLPIANPCSGLPFTNKTSLIDVSGNQYGSYDVPGVGCDLDELEPLSDTADVSLADDVIFDNSSILSVTTDSFDDETTAAFLENELSDTTSDYSIDDNWSDW